MAKLVVLYKTPKDAAAFDKHYAEVHIPLARKLPGLRKYEIGPVMTPMGVSGFHFAAILQFDDMAALQNAFVSAEGQAAAADAQSMASLEILIFDSRDV